MKNFKIFSVFFLCLLLLIPLLNPNINMFAYASSNNSLKRNNYSSTLNLFNITVPFINNSVGEKMFNYSFELNGLSMTPVSTDKGYYSQVNFKGSDGSLSKVGKPLLPFKSYILKIPGDMKGKVKVGLYNIKFKVIDIDLKIAPTPKPLSYLAFQSHMKKTITVEDEKIYSSDKFYPSKLLDYYIGYGLNNYTYVIIWIYPIQYNPVRSQLLLVEKANIGVLTSSYSTHPQEPDDEAVIITTDALKPYVVKLADLYSEFNVMTKIVTTEWIYENYPEAMNITGYNGFYTYENIDPVYSSLRMRYNWSLALRIISYINDTLSHPNLGYITIVGDAYDVPPSFYYYFPLNYNISHWNSWVPTDFFYASPDYDLIPNYRIGRIPFSDSNSIETYINKLYSWYNVGGGSWMRNLIVSGGYPFLTHFMFGESALSTASMEGYFTSFNLTMMSRTEGNYNSTTVENVFSHGRDIWYFSIAHGSGDALWDINLEEPAQAGWEMLTNTSFFQKLPSNNRLPVVSSVACMDGVWDNAILGGYQGQDFSLPSLGEEVLLSKGAGIAYIGSSRISWEILYSPHLDNGLLWLDEGGATKLHLSFIKAYNSMMIRDGHTALGDIVDQGYIDYLQIVGTGNISVATVFMTGLLGDPILQLPTFEKPVAEGEINSITPVNATANITAQAIDWWAEGNVPFYRVDSPGHIEINGVGNESTLSVMRIFCDTPGYYPFLLWYKTITMNKIKLNGNYMYNISFSENYSGYLILKIRAGSREARFILLAAGLFLNPSNISQYGAITLSGVGLDILSGHNYWDLNGWIPFDIYLAGWGLHVTRNPDFMGRISWTVAPLHGPGNYSSMVMPVQEEPLYWWLVDEPLFTPIINNINASYTVTGVKTVDIVQNLSKMENELTSIRDRVDKVKSDLMYNISGSTSNILATINLSENKTGGMIGSLSNQMTNSTIKIFSSILNISRKFSATTNILKEITSTQHIILENISNTQEMILSSLTDDRNAILNEIDNLNSTLTDMSNTFTSYINVMRDDVLVSIDNLSSKLDNISNILSGVISSTSSLSDKVDSLSKTVTDGFSSVSSSLSKISTSISSGFNSLKTGVSDVGSSLNTTSTSIDIGLSTMSNLITATAVLVIITLIIAAVATFKVFKA